MRWWLGCSVAVLAACNGGGSDADDGGGGPPDGGGDADTDTDADSDTDADTDTDTDTPPGEGVAVLGGGTHDLASVTVEVVLDGDDGLNQPTDIEFHPDDDNEAWITNHGDDSMVIVSGALGGSPSVSRRHVITSNHFLAKPSALAFSYDVPFMATAHDEDQPTQGDPGLGGTPADFMGPTLWTSDSAIFDGGDASHADMLHNSPSAMGIAWQSQHVYWVFDGYHSSITRYDFVEPHYLGGTDHSDGIIERWVEGEVSRLPGAVSHLAFDPDSDLLYIADTGNGRIAILDTTTGQEGELYGPAYDSPFQYHWDGAVITTLVDGAKLGLSQPSGLELTDGYLWVSDSLTSTVFALDPATGAAIDWLPLEREAGAIQGLEVDADGNLWVADVHANEVLKISP
jgi:hypothetical protein